VREPDLRGREPGRALPAFLQAPASPTSGWALIVLQIVIVVILDYVTGIETSLSIFYLFPICLATAWFGFAGGAIASGLCTALRFATEIIAIYPHALYPHEWWNISAAFFIFIFIVWLLNTLLALQRELEAKVLQRTSELVVSIADRDRLERALLDATTRERTELGRELHDELGQHWVATALAAQVHAQQTLEPERAHEARAIVRWIEEGIAKTRKIARGLLLASIDPQRLPSELEELATASSRGDILCRFVHRGGPPAIDPAQCAQVFRIAQEAVGNALRHAGCSTITIALTTADRALELTIEDNGSGQAPAADSRRGMGLQIMEQRATFIGAEFGVHRQAGAGTKISCRLPGTNR